MACKEAFTNSMSSYFAVTHERHPEASFYRRMCKMKSEQVGAQSGTSGYVQYLLTSEGG